MPMDKVLANADAERAVLSAIFINPEVVPHLVSVIMPDDMSEPRHKLMLESCMALFDKRIRPTREAVQSYLSKMDMLDRAGGENYLSEVENELRRRAKAGHVTTADAPAWAREVSEYAERRALERLGDEVTDAARDTKKSVDDVRAKVIELAVSGRRNQSDRAAFVSTATGVDDLQSNVEAWLRGERPHSVSTGFESVDVAMAGGLPKGQLTILAGEPEMGKTQFWQNVAGNVTARGESVAVTSLEMRMEELLLRDACRMAGVNNRLLMTGSYGPGSPEAIRLMKAMDDLRHRVNYHISDLPQQSSSDIYFRSLILRASGVPVDVHVTDYAQLSSDIDPENERLGTLMVFRNGKALAKTMGWAEVIVTLLNREVTKSTTKVPQVRHLMQGGEAEADLALGIYNPRKYFDRGDGTLSLPSGIEKDLNGAPRRDRLYVVVMKGRYAGNSFVPLGYEPTTGKMWDLKHALGGVSNQKVGSNSNDF